MAEPNDPNSHQYIADNKSSRRIRLWPWLALYGSVITSGLLLVTVWYFNTGEERAKFLAEGVSGAVILAVIIVQTIIYQQQRNLMAQQLDATAIAERAYLGFDQIGIVNPIANETIVIQAMLVNGGRTPARDVDRKIRVGLVAPPADPPFDWSDAINQPSESGISFMPAGKKTLITFPRILEVAKKDFSDFEAGKRHVYVDGQIRFTDYLGKRQVFAFGMICRACDNGQFQERYQYQRDADPH